MADFLANDEDDDAVTDSIKFSGLDFFSLNFFLWDDDDHDDDDHNDDGLQKIFGPLA